MDNPTQDARYAPPQVNVDDVAPETDGPQLASRKRRFLAFIIDTLFEVALLLIASRLTPYNLWDGDDRGMWSIDLKSMAEGLVIFMVLNGYLLATKGQTIGKALTGIRIARPSGERASLSRLALRYGVGFVANIVMAVVLIYSLVDSVLIFRKSRRCLHDEIADTVVLKA